MRIKSLLVALALLVSGSALVAPAQGANPGLRKSPAGQVNVVVVNAHQYKILGLKRFLSMFELSKAFRARPRGFAGGITPPDIFIINEMRASNLEIFERLLRQRFNVHYEVVGEEYSSAAFIVNTETIEPPEGTTTWYDLCFEPGTPEGGRRGRPYQYAQFVERSTNTPFVVAGIHFSQKYSTTGQQDCLYRNVVEMRQQLAGQAPPIILGGDFNRRARLETHECDPGERSEPQAWWAEMVTPTDGGPAYEDAVFSWHRAQNETLKHEWTHEQKAESFLCDGEWHYKRSRIDYLFSTGAVIADAHADHPGWSGGDPGTLSEEHKYSDHRFVWGRFVVSGPSRPQGPLSRHGVRGDVELTWQLQEGVASWVVYRRKASDDVYRRLGETTETTFLDEGTEHGRTYRYALAPIGADEGQGYESRDSSPLTVDKRGPRVIRVTPSPRATNVTPGTGLEIRFDEAARDGVQFDTVTLMLGDRTIGGRVTQPANRVLKFNPYSRLKKGKTYRAVVRPVRDRYGNLGSRYSWSFMTVAPPPPKKPRRRR